MSPGPPSVRITARPRLRSSWVAWVTSTRLPGSDTTSHVFDRGDEVRVECPGPESDAAVNALEIERHEVARQVLRLVEDLEGLQEGLGHGVQWLFVWATASRNSVRSWASFS